jgi:hypothetical protein
VEDNERRIKDVQVRTQINQKLTDSGEKEKYVGCAMIADGFHFHYTYIQIMMFLPG